MEGMVELVEELVLYVDKNRLVKAEITQGAEGVEALARTD